MLGFRAAGKSSGRFCPPTVASRKGASREGASRKNAHGRSDAIRQAAQSAWGGGVEALEKRVFLTGATLAATLPFGATDFVENAGGTTIYATIPSQGEVVFIDEATLTVTQAISVGTAPSGLALSANGSTLYVADSGSTNIDVVNTTTGAVGTPLALGAGNVPTDVQVGTNNRLWVLVGSTVMQISATTGASAGASFSGLAGDIRITPNGDTLIDAAYGASPSQVYALNVSGASPSLIYGGNQFGANGEDLEMSANGSTFALASGGGNSSGAGFLTDTYAVSTGDSVSSVGLQPSAFAFSKDNTTAFGGVLDTDTITIYGLTADGGALALGAETGTLTVSDPANKLFASTNGDLFVDEGSQTEVYSDAAAGNGAGGIFQVTNGEDEVNGVAVTGSLRAAIIAANAAPGSTIEFSDYPALTPIVLDAALPAITAAGTTIDGLTGPADQVVVDGNPNMPADSAAAGTGFTGLDIQATGALIEGLSLKYFDAAIILDTGSSDAIVEQNYIGDVTNSGRGTNQIGILITNGSSDNAVENNYIGGNLNYTSAYTGTAILVQDPSDLGTTGNTIVSNNIGITPNGSAAPNGRGIVLSDVTGNTVDDNTIAGSTYAFGPSGTGAGASTSGGGAGIVTLTYNGTDREFGNTIQDNTVGLDGIPNQIGVYVDNGSTATAGDAFSGNTVAENTGAGFDIFGSVNTIGGASTTVSLANAIQSNGGTGVIVESNAERNTISENSIAGNGATADGDYGLGIDLGDNGVTLDTPFSGTTEVGPNGDTPFPVLTASAAIGDYTVQATLTGNPNTEYKIEYFTSTAAEESPTGYGQGGTYLTSAILETNTLGVGTISYSLPVKELGSLITATATNLSAYNSASNPDAGATSEFSKDVGVAGLVGASSNINLQIGDSVSLPGTAPTLDKTDAFFTSSGDAPFTAVANYGDGTSLQVLTFNDAGQLTLVHTYPGTITHTYVATVTVYDHSAASTHEFDVKVTAAGPSGLVVKSLTRAALTVTSPFLAIAKFVDPEAAVGERFRVTVNYGDGTAVFRATTQHTSFHLAHQYTHPGKYELVVTVIDSGGLETRYKQVIKVFDAPTDEKSA
jgi:YVTN family beta-propeller protein